MTRQGICLLKYKEQVKHQVSASSAVTDLWTLLVLIDHGRKFISCLSILIKFMTELFENVGNTE